MYLGPHNLGRFGQIGVSTSQPKLDQFWHSAWKFIKMFNFRIKFINMMHGPKKWKIFFLQISFLQFQKASSKQTNLVKKNEIKTWQLNSELSSSMLTNRRSSRNTLGVKFLVTCALILCPSPNSWTSSFFGGKGGGGEVDHLQMAYFHWSLWLNLSKNPYLKLGEGHKSWYNFLEIDPCGSKFSA